MHNPMRTSKTDYISDAALMKIVENHEGTLSDKVAAGTTSPLCIVGGAVTAASAYLDDACPTRACTNAC